MIRDMSFTRLPETEVVVAADVLAHPSCRGADHVKQQLCAFPLTC